MQIIVIGIGMSSCAFLVTQWFILCVLNIIHLLGINLIPHIYIVLYNYT